MILFGAMLVLVFASLHFILTLTQAFPTSYEVSVHIPLNAEPDLNPEGIAVSRKDKDILITGYFNGLLIRDGGSAHTNTTQLFDQTQVFGQMTGIKTDKKGMVYVCLHSTLNGVETEFNGVWKIDPTKAPCGNANKDGCQKIFPNAGENLIFPDGIALREEGNSVFVYVSDPPRGNIWTFKDQGIQSRGTLFAGTDAGSSPNYLQGVGVLFPLGSDFNRIGRGFGVNGLSYDSKNRKLYGAVAETATTVVISIDKDGGIVGDQKVVGERNFFQSYIFDGIFHSECKLYVTIIADLSTGALLAGQKILGYDTCVENAEWKVILDDPLLGTPTDIVNGCGYEHTNKNCDNLYIVDIAGFGLSQYGPNIIVARPSP